MGIYVYSLKKTSERTLEVSGTKVRAAALTFHYKPFFGWSTTCYNVPYEANIARIERAWGQQTPDYVVVGNWVEGAEVRASWPKGRVTWDDCDPLPGVRVGTLLRKGRSWRIVPVG